MPTAPESELPPKATPKTSPQPAPNARKLHPLRALADGLIAVLVGPSCAACDDPLASPTLGPICQRCWTSITTFTPPVCCRCGDPLPSWRAISLESMACPRCRRRTSAIVAARAVGEYDGSLRAIVHALKYGKRRSIARRLALRMGDAAGELLDGVDVAVPVPLHPRRRRARGFNQAEEIAKHLGVRWADALRRTRHTPSQTDLPAARRHANVRGAFAVGRRHRLTGLCVLLVDDVSTTGATLEACARVLRDAGVREVRALTAARVASRRR
jgi:ComF family protein